MDGERRMRSTQIKISGNMYWQKC